MCISIEILHAHVVVEYISRYTLYLFSPFLGFSISAFGFVQMDVRGALADLFRAQLHVLLQ